MKKPPTRWRAVVALAAAYALVLQAFLGSLAASASPAGVAANHVLCLPSGGAAPDLPGAPAEPHHDGCCVLCGASGAGIAAAPAEIGRCDYGSSAPLAVAASAPNRAKAERSPIIPRAPPA